MSTQLSKSQGMATIIMRCGKPQHIIKVVPYQVIRDDALLVRSCFKKKSPGLRLQKCIHVKSGKQDELLLPKANANNVEMNEAYYVKLVISQR